MAEVLHLMYKTLENQAVLLQDCGSKISLNKFCLHDWVSCLILMVECYTFTVYPPNHSHDDPKYSTCSLGYMFNQTVQWKQLLLTTLTLSCRTLETLSSQNCKPYSVLQSSVVFYSHHPKSTTFRTLFRNILSPKFGCWFSVGTGEAYPTTKNSTCLFSQGWPERLQFHLSPREKTLPGMGKGNILKLSSMSMSGTRQTWVNPSLAVMMCNGRQWKKPLAHSGGARWNPSPSQESLGPGTSNHVKQNTFNQVCIFSIKKHMSSMWPMDANGCHLLLENNTFFGFPLSHATHQALDTSTWRSIPEWYGRLCSLPTLWGFPQVVSDGFLAKV